MCHVEVQIIISIVIIIISIVLIIISIVLIIISIVIIIISIVLIIISIVLIIISIVILILEFDRIYERLGATITERGESFYQPMMSGLVEDLSNKGMFRNYNIINY